MKALLEYAIKTGVLLLAAYFGSLFADNILEARRLAALHRRAQAEVRELRRHNQHLIAQAHALQHDPFYIELTMRRKLRWVRPGECRIDEPAADRYDGVYFVGGPYKLTPTTTD